jgi:hypothetical protein
MWKDIPNWEGLYQVNEKGEVKSIRTNKLLVGDTNNFGYYRVCLYNGDIKERFFRHRLVATLFIPNPNNLPEVNHINEDKSDNSVENLEWCSRIYNERANHRSGGKKYTPFRVYFKDGTVKEYEFAIDLGNELNLSKNTILNYLSNKSKGYLNKGIIKLEYI